MVDIQLYNEDYRDVIVDYHPSEILVITDPPYGIGFKYNQHKDEKGDIYKDLMAGLKPYNKVVLQYPEEMMAYLTPQYGIPDDCLAWCYNSNTNRQFRLWGFWGIKPNWSKVLQPAKNPNDKRVNPLVRSYDWFSDIQQCKNVSSEKTSHPCQLPELLIERIIKLCDTKLTIFDPFMGSGTTGVVATKLGLNYVGCEIDKSYFEIAEARISGDLI